MRKFFSQVLLGLKILFKFTLLLPIPAFFVWFNFTVDSSGFFQGEQYEREASVALLQGENLAGYEQMNEQKINALLAKNAVEPFDTIAVGSSRILQLNKAIVNSESFLNCGVSGADIRDIIGNFYLFDKEHKLPKNLIIGIDPWLLNGNPDAYNFRSDVALYDEFLTTKLGLNVNFQPADEMAKYKALVSPSYFQGNLEYYLRGSKLEKTPVIVKADLYDQVTSVKLADGSILYPKDFRNASLEEVNQKAYTEAATFMRMDGFIAPDKELTIVFDKFIQYAQSKGVNVVFLMTPYHPAVYNYATENMAKYPGFFQCEAWFTSYAKKHQIPLYGSYNPFVAGCLEDYFYDGLHITGEGLEHIFPGMKEVAIEQQTGNPGSKWVYEAPRVESDTAEYLVRQRYEIDAPFDLRAAEDQTIEGQQCYLFEQYETQSEDAIMLAKFAVTQNEGVIYRFDTTNFTWTVDNRFS